MKVIELALDKLAHGSSPEEMHFQHPHLSLGQIHAALAYYYDHQAELDVEIERRLRYADELAARNRESPTSKETPRTARASVTIRLYADVHVRRAVIEGLRLRGIDILTAGQRTS